MNSFNIHAVNNQDLNVFYALFVEIQSLHEQTHPEYFRKPKNDDVFKTFFQKTLNDPEQFLDFIYVDKIPIGYAHFQIYNRTMNVFSHARKFAYIHQIIITQKHQKSGYATELINHVKAEVSKQGITEIGIEHWYFNDTARTCFEKAGFKVLREDMLLKL